MTTWYLDGDWHLPPLENNDDEKPIVVCPSFRADYSVARLLQFNIYTPVLKSPRDMWDLPGAAVRKAAHIV